MTQKHIIKKQILDLTLDSSVGSFTLQSEAGALYHREIVPLIDRFCNALDSGEAIIRIDQLEVNLGRIAKKNFSGEFPRKFAQLMPEKLNEAIRLNQSSAFSGTANDVIVSESVHEREYEVLEFFIYEGCLPWWVGSDAPYELPALLQHNLATRPAQVKQLITRIIGNAVLVKRLLDRVADDLIGQIIVLFQPEQAAGMVQLAQRLLTGLNACSLVSACDSARLRSEVWRCLLWRAGAGAGPIVWPEVVETIVQQLAKLAGIEASLLANQLKDAAGDRLAGVLPGAGAIQEQSLNTGESRQPLKQLALMLKELRHTVTQQILPQWLADLEKFLAQLESAPESVTEPQRLQADRKIITKLSQTLATLNRRNAQGQQQTVKKLETVEKLLVQLAAGTKLKARALQLAQLVQTLRDTQRMLDVLQQDRNVAGSVGVGDDHQTNQLATLEASLHQLRNQMQDVTGPNSAAASEMAQKPRPAVEQNERPGNRVAAPPFSAAPELYVGNAGLVLLWPYLNRFLSLLGLVTNNCFNDAAAAERAAFLLHYLVSGTAKASESELTLNKILCGLAVAAPLKPGWEITGPEAVECENLLRAVIFNWSALKQVSVSGLRSLFLQREGLIFSRDGQRVLQVKEAPYDILVNRIPWSISTLKLPWMEQLLLVEWGV